MLIATLPVAVPTPEDGVPKNISGEVAYPLPLFDIITDPIPTLEVTKLAVAAAPTP